MKRILTLILAAIMILSVFAGCGKKEEKADSGKLAQKKFDSFVVGYAKADISPDYTTQIGIVGNNDHNTRLSTGLLEPLMANCIAFTDTEGETVLVYGTDLHSTNLDVLTIIRTQLAEKTGIKPDHIQLNANHNHCGPVQGANSAVGPVKIFTEMFIEKMVAIGVEALENRKPAKMYTGFARPEEMMFVRHYLLKDGNIEAHGGQNVKEGTFYGFSEKGDNLLQMVKFVREGEKDIILFNWQGHPFGSPTEYYTYLNGGGPAVARRVLLEQANTESIYIMGASGDSAQQPALAFARKFKDYNAYGTALANSMIDAFDTFKEAETGKIYYAYNESYVPDGVKAEERMVTKGQYCISAFGFGDFGYVSAPGEMFQTNAIAVRDASPWKYTIYAQISNGGGAGYVPDAFTWAYPNGAYERGPSNVVSGDGEVFEKAQLAMLNDLFEQSGQTKKEKDEGYITVEERNTDGNTYTNPKVGGKANACPNGYYQVTLMLGMSQQVFLTHSKEVADKIMSKSSMKLYTNYSNVVVDCE